jgi:dephospho-CoA kinase
MLLAIVGMSGTGKSTTTRLLQEDLGYTIVYFGGVVMDEVKRRGLPPEQAYERPVREELRQTHGMAAMAVLSLPTILELIAEGKKVAIDGLYSGAEYDYLMENLPKKLYTIAVHSDRSLRYQRLAERPVRPLQHTEVDERDRSELGQLDKARPIVLADYHVLNNQDILDLDQAVMEAVRRIEEDCIE